MGRQRWRYNESLRSLCRTSGTRFKRKFVRKKRQFWLTDAVFFQSLFESIKASRRVRRLTAKPFSTRQQKLYKLCRGYKILGPRLAKYCWGRVPGGVDADEYCEMSVMGTSCTKVVELNYFSTNFF